MKLRVFGSNSKGNGYALTDSKGYTLLIECGVPVLEIKKYLDFDLSKVVGCVSSHSHGDHTGYVKQYINAGIDVYMSFECIKDLNLQGHHKVKGLLPKKKYDAILNEFSVMPLEMKHDVHCFAYIIQHEEMGNTVFITDTYYSPWKFSNINNWIVECNFSESILDGKVSNNETHTFLRNRIIASHLSLENLEDMFSVNDMTKTHNIVLTHLSDTNSDEKLFLSRIKDKTQKKVFAANKGLEINFNKYPF